MYRGRDTTYMYIYIYIYMYMPSPSAACFDVGPESGSLSLKKWVQALGLRGLQEDAICWWGWCPLCGAGEWW